MKFKSIESKLLALSSISLLIMALGLIWSVVFNNGKNQSLLVDKSSALVTQVAHERIVELAKAESAVMGKKLQTASEVAKELAAQLKLAKENGSLTRPLAMEWVKNVLANRPEFLGVFTAWEADQFDGMMLNTLATKN